MFHGPSAYPLLFSHHFWHHLIFLVNFLGQFPATCCILYFRLSTYIHQPLSDANEKVHTEPLSFSVTLAVTFIFSMFKILNYFIDTLTPWVTLIHDFLVCYLSGISVRSGDQKLQFFRCRIMKWGFLYQPLYVIHWHPLTHWTNLCPTPTKVTQT